MAKQHNAFKLIRTLSLTLASTLFTACGGNPMKHKFDWLATESAPKGFPMKIVSGSFIAPDGYSLYIPTKTSINNGWGEFISTHVTGPDLKSLPNRLEITFFSFTENTFYQGNFDLPYDTLVRLFNEGYYSPKRDDHATYDRIMVGVAPGGTVAVWLVGINRNTEVLFAKAEKTDAVPWSRVLDNPRVSREYIVNKTLNGTLGPEKLQELKQNGIPFGLWDSYRTHYPWQPVIIADQPPAFIDSIYYFNGEEDYFRYPLDEATAAATRPIPRYVYYIWDNPEGKTSRLGFNFDEAEITAAFQKLSPEAKTPLQLEFHSRVIKGERLYAVQLSKGENENENENENEDEDAVILRKWTIGKKL